MEIQQFLSRETLHDGWLQAYSIDEGETHVFVESYSFGAAAPVLIVCKATIHCACFCYCCSDRMRAIDRYIDYSEETSKLKVYPTSSSSSERSP
ncbi:hypothetical protein Y032_0022g628 [Ancylostoma ceylanicum]|uniref:Uncharacterized protein n=1 Tax=Ancylostoma ceylanicum TaxID=53326 RepID=A0A016V137_9BILA|nr:hypothetical protein Y032_0022g628 [Ancylostoma ceylanicum]